MTRKSARIVRRKRGGKVGFAVVAWIPHLEEWGVFIQGENREYLVQFRDRLEVFGVIARLVDCELCEGGDVNLFETLDDPKVSGGSSIDVDRPH